MSSRREAPIPDLLLAFHSVDIADCAVIVLSSHIVRYTRQGTRVSSGC
jgi:hypothetical protein